MPKYRQKIKQPHFDLVILYFVMNDSFVVYFLFLSYENWSIMGTICRLIPHI